MDLGLRERRKQATRQSLQESAVRLVSDRGPDAVTVEDICTASGVSPRTFFNYFATKEEAIFGWDSDARRALTDDIIARPAGEPPLRAIRIVFGGALEASAASGLWEERLRIMRDYPQLVPRMAVLANALQDALAEAVAIRTGRPNDDLYVTVTAAAAVGAARAAVQALSDDPRRAAAKDAFDAAFSYLGSGLEPPSS